MSARLNATAMALALVLPVGALHAQGDSHDGRAVALAYHKLTGLPLDVRAIAERSDAMRAATAFDRPDVLKVQVARLERELVASDPGKEFFVRVDDNISEYDHGRGEFSVMLFRPGFYVPLDVFGQQYRLVFANAEAVRAIPMPKDAARAFDAKLTAGGRYIANEIRFRITGSGDPAGAVTGERVIRADIVGVRLLDRAGAPVFTPTLAAVSAAPSPAPMDLAHADIAGLRVGVRVRDMEATLTRFFGKVDKRPRSASWYAGFSSALLVNEMGCMSLPLRGRAAQPGAVCVSAWADERDVVRSIRVERVFPWLEQEAFRAPLVRKYGPVGKATAGSSYALGWGAPLDSSFSFDRSGPGTAITARYEANDDPYSRGGNALPKIRVVLELVDAAWIAARKK